MGRDASDPPTAQWPGDSETWKQERCYVFQRGTEDSGHKFLHRSTLNKMHQIECRQFRIQTSAQYCLALLSKCC